MCSKPTLSITNSHEEDNSHHIFTQAKKKDEKIASNIKAMQESISKHGIFHEESTNQGLWDFLDNIQASPEVSHDMLALRTIGPVINCI